MLTAGFAASSVTIFGARLRFQKHTEADMSATIGAKTNTTVVTPLLADGGLVGGDGGDGGDGSDGGG